MLSPVDSNVISSEIAIMLYPIDSSGHALWPVHITWPTVDSMAPVDSSYDISNR